MKAGVTRLVPDGEGRRLVLLVPAIMLLVVVLFVPLGQLLSLSVTAGRFEPYAKIAHDPLFLKVVGMSFRIAGITTLICLLLAYPLSYFLATSRPLVAGIGLAFVLLPFWTSLLMRTYAWMVLLGRKGILNNALLDWGLIAKPLPLMYNSTGVIIGTVHYLVPFMVFPIYAAMKRVDGNLLLAAEGLGASRLSVFLRVYFPLTLNGVFAGVALVFIIALSAYVTPALLGGGRVLMIANLIQMQASQLLDWPMAGALSLFVVVITVGVYSALGLIAARRDGRSR